MYIKYILFIIENRTKFENFSLLKSLFISCKSNFGIFRTHIIFFSKPIHFCENHPFNLTRKDFKFYDIFN